PPRVAPDDRGAPAPRPGVGRVRIPRVAPRIQAAIGAARRRLPLFFSRQASAFGVTPRAVTRGFSPRDACDRQVAVGPSVVAPRYGRALRMNERVIFADRDFVRIDPECTQHN